MANLTNTRIRNTKPGDKPVKLTDGQGLYLDVRPSGSKIWRYCYWITPKKDGIFAIGEYPAVSLADARKEKKWAREQVKQGLNPTQTREAERLQRINEHANTFETVACEWIEQNRAHWSANYCKQVETFLGKDVFPKIGAFSIRMVRATPILEIIRNVEKRGA